MKHERLYWISVNGEWLCEQVIEDEDETSVKLLNHNRRIPKSIIGDENKTYYNQHYFWTEEARDEYYEATQIPRF